MSFISFLLNLSFQEYAAFVFILFLTIFVIVKRKKVAIQGILPVFYFVLYRTKIGLKFMKRVADRHNKLVKILGSIGVVVGFLGMVLIIWMIVGQFLFMIKDPSVPSGVQPVLPFNIKGAVYVPFFHWISVLLLIVIVHEMSHGLLSNAYKVPVKSSGFAIFGIVLPLFPAAFVEPDEKILVKKPAWQQLSVYAAGPFANILFALLTIGIIALVSSSLSHATLIDDGVEIRGFLDSENYPSSAKLAGLSDGEIIESIDGYDVTYIENLSTVMSDKHPGEIISLETNKQHYEFELGQNPKNESLPFMGVSIGQHVIVNPVFKEKYGSFLTGAALWLNGDAKGHSGGSIKYSTDLPPDTFWAFKIIYWLMGGPTQRGFLFWLFQLNVGIGLINLLPLGPVDGGRMLQIVLKRLFPKKKGKKDIGAVVWKLISLFFFAIVLYMLFGSFLR